MNYTLIIRPIIGAVIGYVTNYIAVKMLFRPLNPIKIGKMTLPFTPGVVPKNKERIASAIGETISNHLLTEEAFSKELLSEEKKALVYEKVQTSLTTRIEDLTLKEGILKMISDDSLETIEKRLNMVITKSIVEALIEQDTGRIIASQIETVAKEKVHNSMLGMLGVGSLISNMTSDVARKINEYIEKNGDDFVSSIVTKKMMELEEKKIPQLLNNSEEDIAKLTMNLYEKVICEKLPSILNAIDIAKIVTDKIRQMDNHDMEQLILKIMKKELNALIGLGALIGFILGLLNLLV